MELARPAVVAKAAPERQNILLRGFGQFGDGGESHQKLFVVAGDGLGARLLQHHLRDPDLVGVGSTPPRLVAPGIVEPGEQVAG